MLMWNVCLSVSHFYLIAFGDGAARLEVYFHRGNQRCGVVNVFYYLHVAVFPFVACLQTGIEVGHLEHLHEVCERFIPTVGSYRVFPALRDSHWLSRSEYGLSSSVISDTVMPFVSMVYFLLTFLSLSVPSLSGP